jgi:glycerate kinase
MKIVIAPNAFKGSLTALEAADAMAEGVRRAAPKAEILGLPISDGGDGLVEVLERSLGGELIKARVTGPRERLVEARYLWFEERSRAVIEMAEASGIVLLDEAERDPTATTSKGTGELIARALDRGAEHLIVGIGGSATCDGGCGMAAALGIRFMDPAGVAFVPKGGTLERIARIDRSGLDPRIGRARIDAACDVRNPLVGPQGAARVYAPQKGADSAAVDTLEKGLCHLARIIERDLGKEPSRLAGTGAAGGMGAGLWAFLGAGLKAGVEMVLDLVNLEGALDDADLVLTGEGRLDEQTLFGKAPAGVARRAREKGIPCMALAGSIHGDPAALHKGGFCAFYPLSVKAQGFEESMADAGRLLADATERAVRIYFEDSTEPA